MALNPAQQRIANMIFTAGIRAGLSPQHARELVANAYAESRLNPRARNPKSGAAGLFQLLSSGYVNAANRMGGVDNPQANINAILPQYVRYWRAHPNARPGEAGRDVELSGEGAGFYSSPLASLGPIGGGSGATTAVPAGNPPPGSQSAPDLVRQSILRSLASGGNVDFMALARVAQRQRQQQLTSPGTGTLAAAAASGDVPGPTQRRAQGGLAEAFYDPLGSYDNGRFGSAIGGHSDHVHLSITNPQSMLAAIAYAQAHGLRVGENPYVGKVYPVHVKDSFHYRDFPGAYGGHKLGEAIDVSGSPAAMAAYYKWATSHLR